mmetsp:Transcript_7173/g.10162  ORF Transcript_7173/g.10162 Transcript_7173/m.10162 type:complete len:274 (+) Transcript_7173:108-929(+)
MSFQFDHWELDDEYTSSLSSSSNSTKSCEDLHTVKNSKKKRKVQYANTCAVILIPTRREYIDAGIDLWYSRSDQSTAQSQVASEVKRLMDFNPSLKLEQAMSFLYQPRTDYINSFSQACHSFRESLSIMIIDRSLESFMDSSRSITQSLQTYYRWITTCAHAISAEDSLKIVSSAPGVVNKMDIILLDSNLYECGDINYLSLLRMFRSVYGESILIGLLFPSLSEIEEDFRVRAVNVGIDFMWSKPIMQYVEMLPLMIAARDKKNGLISLSNS